MLLVAPFPLNGAWETFSKRGQESLIRKSAEAVEIAPLDAVEITVEPWTWPFAQARREDMDRHFAARQRERPALWNGRVMLLHRCAREKGVLHGASFETDYASVLAWCDWGRPAAGVFNIAAVAALQSADGAFLLGQMAPSTALAGQWVFPGGTPDPHDISPGGKLDLLGSVARELGEETGLDIGVCKVEPGWTLVRDGGFLALIKGLTVNESAERLRAKIMDHLASEAQPEFSAIRIVRGPADFDPTTARFIVEYLTLHGLKKGEMLMRSTS
jgi:8-oxo-dGTP pyrophosphatase MutT (NUDIX family)